MYLVDCQLQIHLRLILRDVVLVRVDFCRRICRFKVRIGLPRRLQAGQPLHRVIFQPQHLFELVQVLRVEIRVLLARYLQRDIRRVQNRSPRNVLGRGDPLSNLLDRLVDEAGGVVRCAIEQDLLEVHVLNGAGGLLTLQPLI